MKKCVSVFLVLMLMCYMVANQLFNVTIHKSVLCHMRLMKDILKSADVL